MIVDCKLNDVSVVEFDSDTCPNLDDKIIVNAHDGVDTKIYSVINREFVVSRNHPMIRSSNGTNLSLKRIICNVKESG